MFKHSLNPRAPSFEPMASDSESREHTKMVSRNLDPRAPSFEPMASNNKSQIAAITALNVRSSPLIRLPGELRNLIYGYALGEDRFGCYGFVRRTHPTLAWGERENRLALLRVCHQIYEEAALLPFSLNEFKFAYCKGFLDFCLALGPTKRRAIRKLRLTERIFKSVKLAVSDLPAHGFGSLSQLLPNLQRVHVYTRTFPKMFGQQIAQKKTRDEKILEDWVRAGLKGDVEVKVVFWEPY